MNYPGGSLQLKASAANYLTSVDLSEINRKQGTKFNMPVLYYSQLLTVAYGGSIKEAGLDGHLIQPKRLQEIASKK